MHKLVLELTGFSSYATERMHQISESPAIVSDPTNETKEDLHYPDSTANLTTETDFETILINAYLIRFKTLCENTSITYMTSSLVAIWIFRSILIQVSVSNYIFQ